MALSPAAALADLRSVVASLDIKTGLCAADVASDLRRFHDAAKAFYAAQLIEAGAKADDLGLLDDAYADAVWSPLSELIDAQAEEDAVGVEEHRLTALGHGLSSVRPKSPIRWVAPAERAA